MRWTIAVALVLLATTSAFGQRAERGAPPGPDAEFSQILGRPTDHSCAVSLLSAKRL